MVNSQRIHVAAAAIVNPAGQVLLARRPEHLHQGGLWEFPGGKLEPGEDVRDGLVRELQEELGITATRYRPLIRVHHDYPDCSVLLDVWRVEGWRGEPHGREGQPVAWVEPRDLLSRPFPAANRPIVSAVRLPERYLITPEPGEDGELFLRQLDRSLTGGITLVQLRARSLPPGRFERLATRALAACRARGAALILNGPPDLVQGLGADGVHLPASRLMAADRRPLPQNLWVGASCHTAAEVEHACRIGVDFIVASPVLPTRSHPGADAMGWDGVHLLTEAATVPVYALGGMQGAHLDLAWHHGAQGIAAIRGLWHAEPPTCRADHQGLEPA